MDSFTARTLDSIRVARIKTRYIAIADGTPIVATAFICQGISFDEVSIRKL
jgi:hypothetical protein